MYFFLLCLFAEVAQCFLLPEQKIWMLILPAAAVCSFAADHRLEVRAKFLEVLCPILTFPVMLLLLVLAVLTIRGGQFGTLGEMMRPSAPGSIWIAGIAMLSVFAGLGSDVFLQRATKEQQSRSVFEKTTGSMLIGSLLLLFLLQAVFGAGGIRALPFSVITAMSNSKIKGVFFAAVGCFICSVLSLAWSVGHWYQDSPFLGLAVNDFCPEKREVEVVADGSGSKCCSVRKPVL